MEVPNIIKRTIKEGMFREMWKETVWMLRYIRRYRLVVFVHIVIGVAGILMALLSSLAMRRLIDVVTGYRYGGIVSAASFMIGMQVGSVLMQAITSRIAAVINIKVQNSIQAEVYDRMLRTDWQSLEQFRSGDLINRLNSDVSGVAGGITSFFPSFVSNSAQFFGSLVIILFYDPTMALIALIGAPVYVLSSRMLVNRMREYNNKMKEIGSQVMSFHEDSFRNISSIKSFGIMDGFRDRMHNIQQTYRTAFLEYNRFSVIAGFVMSIMGLAISIGCFGWGVYRLWTKVISYGTMTMFIQLTNMLRSAFSALVGLVPAYISIVTSAGRIMAVTELPEEPGSREEAEVPEECAVCLRDVSFTYANDDEPVLEHVNFSANPGELVAITGPSGEGKTTILRLILGLVHPDSGEAVLCGDGREIELSAATRRAFSYVPQGNTILAGTIADNLRMVKTDASEDEMYEALRLACASKFVSRLPDGVNSNVGELGRGFSEGQAQRIAVARALLQHAPVLILDEATNALDEDTEREMLKNITESGIVNTCIIITHRPATANICTRRYVLKGTGITEKTND